MTFDFPRCFVIAEIGVNHNGDPALARRLIEAAAAAGADAVKFQTFRADDLVTRSAGKAAYQIANTGSADSQHAMLSGLELSAADFAGLRDHCLARGIAFLSTPFSEAAADLLERIGVGAYKVSSGDLTHHALIAHIARKGKPVILSSGMATLGEVEEALAVIDATGRRDVAILHCVSNYPAAPADCNLAAMATMARAFGRPVGWSDHTEGEAVSIAAVALGAKIIEKHITLDRTLPGPDHAASMEPAAFSAFVAALRAVEAAIGSGIKQPTGAERQTATVARRSLVTTRALARGAVLAPADLAVMRPGHGLAPKYRDLVTGRVLACDLAEGVALELRHLGDG